MSLRILHLVDAWTRRGGAGWFAQWLAGRQAAGGHRVAVAAGRILDEPASRGVPVERVGMLARRTPGVDLGALDALVARVEPDVVWVHAVVNPTALRWASEHGAVMTVHDHRVYCPGRGRWTLAGQVCREAPSSEACGDCFEDPSYARHVIDLTRERLAVVRNMRAVHVLSRAMARDLAEAGVAPQRIEVIPPPAVVPNGVLRAERRRECVLFAGRLVEAKGVFDALEAWRRSGVPLSFVAAGDGPVREAVEAAGGRALGWLEREELAAWMRRAAVLVMPSRWQEPFGMVGIEALVLGCPVAAWRSGGIEEWHPGDGLVAWGDVDGLARAIGRLARSEVCPRPRIDVREDSVYARLDRWLRSVSTRCAVPS